MDERMIGWKGGRVDGSVDERMDGAVGGCTCVDV